MCAKRYYITMARKCAKCHAGCAGKCASDGSCPGLCKPGFGKIGGKCVRCMQPHCANCDGDTEACRRCEALGYGLVDSKCLPCNVERCDVCQNGNLNACQMCAFGQYRTQGNKCERCPQGCVEDQCRSDGTCKKCKPTHGLVDGLCRKCSVDSCLNCDGSQFECIRCERNRGLLNTKSCEKCDTTVNCNDTCEWCDGNVKQCSECGPLEFRTPQKLCEACSTVMDNCATCTNATTCTGCWIGYGLIHGKCMACPRGCDNCAGNPGACRRCSSFQVLEQASRRCIPL